MASVWPILQLIVIVALSFAALGNSACRPHDAEEGKPLVLSCSVTCLVDRPVWRNRTVAGATEVIPSDSGMIDSETGALTLTPSATPSYGGQRYECSCGRQKSCVIIHYPSDVSITVEPMDAVVGSEVNITCHSLGGYPHQTAVSLFLPDGVETVQSGIPHILDNVTMEDAGELKCSILNLPTQPSSSATLNVYSRPELLDSDDSTEVVTKGENTALLCTVQTHHCQALVQFLVDGKEIEQDDKRFRQIMELSEDGEFLNAYLVILGVREEDVGRHYQCVAYADLSTMIEVESKDLTLQSHAPSSGKECTEKRYLIVLGVVLGVIAVAGWLLAIILCIARCRCFHKTVEGTGV